MVIGSVELGEVSGAFVVCRGVDFAVSNAQGLFRFQPTVI
jgi:hypothetical protein